MYDISYFDTDISQMIHHELIKLVCIILIHKIDYLICFHRCHMSIHSTFFNEALRFRFEYEVYFKVLNFRRFPSWFGSSKTMGL